MGPDENILVTVKRNMTGITPDNHDFDSEILDHINTYIRFLNRFGIGTENFYATAESMWSDLLGDDLTYYMDAKDYITLKIKYWWDPPTVGAAVSAIENSIKEIEFNLMMHRECPDTYRMDDE